MMWFFYEPDGFARISRVDGGNKPVIQLRNTTFLLCSESVHVVLLFRTKLFDGRMEALALCCHLLFDGGKL